MECCRRVMCVNGLWEVKGTTGGYSDSVPFCAIVGVPGDLFVLNGRASVWTGDFHRE